MFLEMIFLYTNSILNLKFVHVKNVKKEAL